MSEYPAVNFEMFKSNTKNKITPIVGNSFDLSDQPELYFYCQ